ncbi:MAG: site-specific integrase [Aggregatilineales bacterium]
MNDIIIQPHESSIAHAHPAGMNHDMEWLNYFDPYRALEDVIAHIRTLPSSDTPEKHTLHVYSAGIKEFFEWGYRVVYGNAPANDEIIHPLPDKPLVQRFIAYLKATDRSTNTISSKYLAPLRHYIRALHEQSVPMPTDVNALIYLMTCRDRMRAGEKVKAPPSNKTTNLSALYAHGTRFNLEQVNATLRSLDRLTLSGLRDYALLMVGFNCGLRVAELQRLSRANFRAEGDHYLLVDLRGKRNNYDPIPLGKSVVDAVDAYLTAWNDELEPSDPRRINAGDALWQPLKKNGTMLKANRYSVAKGITTRSISRIIHQRTLAATGISLASHDLRRTMTAIADESGMARKAIRRITRHKSVAQTDAYIGDGKPNWGESVLAYYAQIGG